MAGFVLAIILMSVMVYNVMQNKIDMVSDNYYEKELTFQQQIDAEKNAQPFKDSFSIAKNGDNIILRVPASLSNRLDSGSVHFYAPANQQADRLLPIARKADGVYIVDAKDWQKTVYKPRIKLYAAGTEYYQTLYIQL